MLIKFYIPKTNNATITATNVPPANMAPVLGTGLRVIPVIGIVVAEATVRGVDVGEGGDKVDSATLEAGTVEGNGQRMQVKPDSGEDAHR